jgi:hypothetical protein
MDIDASSVAEVDGRAHVLNRFNATHIKATLIGLVAAASLAGCVVTPVGVRAGVYVGPGYGPPAPAADVMVGVAPARGYIWTAALCI